MTSKPTASHVESKSALVQESAGSSKAQIKSKDEDTPRTPSIAAVGTKYTLKSEVPALPVTMEPAFLQSSTASLAAGNQAYHHELKQHGRLGQYFNREICPPDPVFVEFQPVTYYNGIRFTLRGALTRLHRLKKELGDADFQDRVESISDSLATGCVVTTYMKFQALTYTENHLSYINTSLKRPRAPQSIPIATPFAFAIQQIGAVNVADQISSIRIVPCFPQTGHNFGLPEPVSWNPNTYAQAVEYARKLGMRFAIVDRKVKNGTPWYLLRQYYSENVFELQCIIPETNYTESMAGTHALFLREEPDNPSNPFVQLNQFGRNYGTMLKSPHPGINLTTFEAIQEASNEIWANV